MSPLRPALLGLPCLRRGYPTNCVRLGGNPFRHVTPSIRFQCFFRAASTSTTSRSPPKSGKATVTLLASGGLLSLFAIVKPENGNTRVEDERNPNLPRFRLSEIRAHGARSERPWVTCGDKVYDITDWVPAHPGGRIILRAAGGSIDKYWDIFSVHKAPHAREILDQYLIGLVDSADLVRGKIPSQDVEDPFVHDPPRHPDLIVMTDKPRNAATPATAVTDSFLTSNELFFVRNHMWVPKVDGDEARRHNLTVELPDGTTKCYSLRDIKAKFTPVTVTATLQCSGNRRKHMSENAAATNGIQWSTGAISTADWEGVRLADLLEDAGFPASAARDAKSSVKHVHFSGLEAYGASIPIATALDPRGDVILAYSMNGKPLPPDHGFPLRAIVPGHVAARSVKWLNHIALSDEESPSQWQRRDYKAFGPNEGPKPNWDRARSIQELPITSAVTIVHAVAKGGCTSSDVDMDASTGIIRGYAYSGGGREIIRVDISLDHGKTWDQAELIDDCANGACKGQRSWTWKRWRYATILADEGDLKCISVTVKATDDAYNTQPGDYKGIYNFRGNLANAWHRTRLCVSAKDLRKQGPLVMREYGKTEYELRDPPKIDTSRKAKETAGD